MQALAVLDRLRALGVHADDITADSRKAGPGCVFAAWPGQRTDGGPGRAFTRHHGQDLPARQAQVCQQAELLAPGQHLCAEARRHAEQADRNGHGLQPVGDSKTAVEDAQRGGADLGGRGELQPSVEPGSLRRAGTHSRRAAHVRLHLGGVCPIGQPQGQVVHAPVAGQALIVMAVDHDGAGLPGVVAPHTCYEKSS